MKWSFSEGSVNRLLFAGGLPEGISLWDTEAQLKTSSRVSSELKKTAKSLVIFING